MSTDRFLKNNVRRGMDTWDEEIQQDEALKEATKGKLFRYMTKAGNDKDFVFLTDEPYIFDEHFLKDKKMSVLCTHDECPFCANGVKTTKRSGFLVLDLEGYDAKIYENGKDTGKTERVETSLKFLVLSRTDTTTILAKAKRNGELLYNQYNVMTFGAGTEKNNVYERIGRFEMTPAIEKSIRDRLPEKLKDLSWDDIALEQLIPSQQEEKKEEKMAPAKTFSFKAK